MRSCINYSVSISLDEFRSVLSATAYQKLLDNLHVGSIDSNTCFLIKNSKCDTLEVCTFSDNFDENGAI